MFASRRSIRVAAAAAFAVTLVSEPAAAAVHDAATPAPRAANPPHASGTRRAGAPPFAHALKHPTTSTNWAGYAATGGKFDSVTTTFTQPALNCSKGDGYSSFWVGLDGYNTRSVEQTGTEADCIGGIASYSAWYEMYPKYPVTYHAVVRPGDVITASVTYQPDGVFTVALTDHTAGWSRTFAAKAPEARRSSAEVVAEAPDSGGTVLPLADFGSVAFGGSSVNGSSLKSANPVGMNMVSVTGRTEASVSGLSGGSFSIKWDHK